MSLRVDRRSFSVATESGIGFIDLSEHLRRGIAASGVRDGFAVISAPHTTTAIIVNEAEPRRLQETRAFLQRLVPSDARYLHNDIHLRDCPPDEPENAHSHIAAVLLGHSQIITVSDGRPALGTYQSVLLAELDGPRERTVTLQVMGTPA